MFEKCFVFVTLYFILAPQPLRVYGGRYGLGGADLPPFIAFAVFSNMFSSNPKTKFSFFYFFFILVIDLL
jgi:hypothetical protein